MTTEDSRHRPKIQRHSAAATTVATTMVGVADSMVMALLSDSSSGLRYPTSRPGMLASHVPNAVDGNTWVIRYPSATMKATRQAAGTTSAPTSRLTPPTHFER